MTAGTELIEPNHPGFNDPVYREGRQKFADIALAFRDGDPIPRVEYSKQESEVWMIVFDKLKPLHKNHACQEYLRMLPLLERHCGYRADNIPQVPDVSKFLEGRTRWTLRPAAGFLQPRAFLYGLAFRKHFCTRYMRHFSEPFYTQEPDVLHDMMHTFLLADPKFADFSQAIGMASLGATDEQIVQLARCYWYTVEFGLCIENGELKIAGAGILSSVAEILHSMSDKPEILPFNPFIAAHRDYPPSEHQQLYFKTESFESATKQMQEFSKRSLCRPFNVHFNQSTQTVEVDRNVEMVRPKEFLEGFLYK
jgi:tryptophan 5-monooxygenase